MAYDNNSLAHNYEMLWCNKGKPEGELTPLNAKAFEKADTLVRGAIIGVLGENIIDSYLSITTGMRLRPSLRSRMHVLNYMSWRISMTIRWLMRSVVKKAYEIQSIAK
jgi:hypothetical protein